MIAAAGLREAPGRPLVDTLVEYLRVRRVLVVLDNCEHLLAACAGFVDTLLRACPSLTILTTSRSPLGVPGEITWRVPSMSLPTEPALQPIESLRQFDAVSLFIDRALQVRPDFAVTAGTAPAVAQICHDLDGIPLAIELAAARVRVMAPEQICRALSDRFHVLTGGTRTVMPRQQTLQASLDWSYDLLSADERTLLRWLSIFAGGWTLGRRRAGLIGRGNRSLRGAGFVDRAGGQIPGDHRRSGSRNALWLVGDGAPVRLRPPGPRRRDRGPAGAAPGLLPHPGPNRRTTRARRRTRRPVLHTLATELPNLRAALEWAAVSDPNAGLRLVNALTLFWLFTGRYQEGDATYARALDAAEEQPTPLRGRALAGRGHLAQHGGAYQPAHEWGQAALETGQACGNLSTQGRALNILGRSVAFRDPTRGRPLLQRSAQLATQAGDDWCRISALQTLALAWIFQDEFDTARPILEDAYTSTTRLSYQRGFALHWFCLGWEAMVRGRLDEGRQLLPRAVAASDEVGDPFFSGLANGYLTYIYLICNHNEFAYALATENLRRVRESGAGVPLGLAYQMLGRTEMALGHLAAAPEHLHTAVHIDRRGLVALLAWDLTALGTLQRIEGDSDAARACGEEALELTQRLGSTWIQAGAQRLLGRLALAAGQASQAKRYLHDALGRLV
ncbi:MAG: hypothetical protein JO287_16485 [Pseudonocardiales bacterium]|nr:hypothetical protein [Pseudonocardiales bacterium]